MSKKSLSYTDFYTVPGSGTGCTGPGINPAWQKQFSMSADGMLFQEAVSMSIATFRSIFWPVAV